MLGFTVDEVRNLVDSLFDEYYQDKRKAPLFFPIYREIFTG